MKVEEKEFKELLSGITAKERRAYKRATVYTAIPVIIGLLLLGLSAYKAITLQQQAALVADQIRAQSVELERIRTNIAIAKEELDSSKKELEDAKNKADVARKALEDITATGDAKKQARQAQKALETLGNTKKRSDQSTVASNPSSTERGQSARPTDPAEVARRAIVNAVSSVSGSAAKQIDFDRTLEAYGIISRVQIIAFIMSLKNQLPEIKDKIDEDFRSLQPQIKLSFIFNVLRRELSEA